MSAPPTPDRRCTRLAFYDWQKSEFDNALPYKYERLGLDLGYQVSRTVTLLGMVGVESDLDESSTQGGLDSSFWNVGARWDPNDRTSAEARYGERFFGSSWSLEATHRARLLEFDASYSEEPTVETRTLSLGQFNPGELPPGAPDVDFGRFNSSPFIARNATAGVRAVGSLTTLGLRAFQYERDYLRGVPAGRNAERHCIRRNAPAGVQPVGGLHAVIQRVGVQHRSLRPPRIAIPSTTTRKPRCGSTASPAST